MSNQPIGNEEQMAQIKQMIATKEKADEINQGDKATNVVPVEYISDFGEEYKGKFIFKRPNVMDTMKMGGRKSQLLQQAGVTDLELVDNSIRMLAEAVATLEAVIVKSPEWMIEPSKVEDAGLIFHVYGKYQQWQYSFRINGGNVQEGDSEASDRA